MKTAICERVGACELSSASRLLVSAAVRVQRKHRTKAGMGGLKRNTNYTVKLVNP